MSPENQNPSPYNLVEAEPVASTGDALERNESQVRTLHQMSREQHIAVIDRPEQKLDTNVGAERRLNIPARISMAKVAIASAINRIA